MYHENTLGMSCAVVNEVVQWPDLNIE